MQKIAIIVPCYNERKRMNTGSFSRFLLDHEDTEIYFVDDGSDDGTPNVLHSIRSTAAGRVHIISLTENRGKANAVREGLRIAAGENRFRFLGYLDADLSTGPEEFYSLYQRALGENLDYVIGSRIKLLQSSIERSFFRHLTGRFIATIIDWKYKLGIYDTQCGAKWFRPQVIIPLLEEKFHTKWFFDVEIFLRMRRKFPSAVGIEVPLRKWKDPGNSKIGLSHFPTVFSDLYALMSNYPRNKK